MGKREEKLLKQAQDIYKFITPCGTKQSFDECFTEYGDKLFFWFDTEDESTHLLIEDIAI